MSAFVGPSWASATFLNTCCSSRNDGSETPEGGHTCLPTIRQYTHTGEKN